MTKQLPNGTKLAPQWALQHPQDWLDAASESVAQLDIAGSGHDVVAVGVDFTSCTVLPVNQAIHSDTNQNYTQGNSFFSIDRRSIAVSKFPAT